MNERPAPEDAAREVAELLEREEADLRRLVRHEAGAPLLRFEPVDDLLQGIRLHALRVAAHYESRGPREARAWLRQVARAFLGDRRSHWFALKRGGGQLLRYTMADSDEASPGGAGLVDSTQGPRTKAEWRDQLVTLARALELLLPRDRDVVRWISQGLSTREVAGRIGVEASSAERVRSRAFKRLRRAWELAHRLHDRDS